MRTWKGSSLQTARQRTNVSLQTPSLKPCECGPYGDGELKSRPREGRSAQASVRTTALPCPRGFPGRCGCTCEDPMRCNCLTLLHRLLVLPSVCRTPPRPTGSLSHLSLPAKSSPPPRGAAAAGPSRGLRSGATAVRSPSGLPSRHPPPCGLWTPGRNPSRSGERPSAGLRGRASSETHRRPAVCRGVRTPTPALLEDNSSRP